MIATLTNLLGPNLLLLVGIVVLLFGGKKLPDLARGLRDSIREFKRGKDDPEAPVDPAPPTKKPDNVSKQ